MRTPSPTSADRDAPTPPPCPPIPTCPPAPSKPRNGVRFLNRTRITAKDGLLEMERAGVKITVVYTPAMLRAPASKTVARVTAIDQAIKLLRDQRAKDVAQCGFDPHDPDSIKTRTNDDTDDELPGPCQGPLHLKPVIPARTRPRLWDGSSYRDEE
jgi:hypothetical protein